MASDQDTRERLLDAAGPVFADKGFQEATIREICQQACVNVAAVNYHFGDKERLYIETVKRARTQRARQFPLPDWPADATAEERLEGFITTTLRRMLEPELPWQTRLMMREMIEPTQACRELVEEYIRPQFETLLGIVSDLVGRNVPLPVRRRICFSVLGQCLVYRVAEPVVQMLTPRREHLRHYSVVDLARHITWFTLAACGQRPGVLVKEPAVRPI